MPFKLKLKWKLSISVDFKKASKKAFATTTNFTATRRLKKS